MKSKTVKFNLTTLLSTMALILGTYLYFPGIPNWLFVVMAIASMIISELLTYFNPSGEFVGSGQSWTIGKWITRVGLSVIAIFGLLEGMGWAVKAIAALTPVIEIIIRMYGSDTSEQQAAARMAGARGE